MAEDKKKGTRVGKTEAEVLAELQAQHEAGMAAQHEEFAYDEEELFPGGPSKADIARFKAQFGEGNVYATEFDDEFFIWRTLTRMEYKEIMKLQKADAMYREERICEKCVLWPEGYTFIEMNEGKAGIPSVLAEQIMERSGFAPNGEAKKL